MHQISEKEVRIEGRVSHAYLFCAGHLGKNFFNKVTYKQRLKVNETNSSLGRRTGESQDPMAGGALGMMPECGNESRVVSMERFAKE